MSDVQVKLKVMPEESTDLDDLRGSVKASIPEGAELAATEEEPVAFGLKALMVVVVVPDAEGGSEAVEEALADLEGVQSVQVVDLSRTM